MAVLTKIHCTKELIIFGHKYALILHNKNIFKKKIKKDLFVSKRRKMRLKHER